MYIVQRKGINVGIKRNKSSKNPNRMKMSVPKMGFSVSKDNQRILDAFEEKEKKKHKKKKDR